LATLERTIMTDPVPDAIDYRFASTEGDASFDCRSEEIDESGTDADSRRALQPADWRSTAEGLVPVRTWGDGTGRAADERPIVFIVDDDISVRGSLELLVRTAGWIPQINACGREFLSRPRADVPNCLILDLNLSDLNGLDIQKLICAERTETPIIFVSGFGNVPVSVKAMKAGAIEFLTKPIDEEALLGAIENALERSRAQLARNSEVQELRERYASLSRRERQIMALVVSGKMNKQIAFALGISEVTVKAHRGQMNRKMMARSVPDLVNMCAKLDLGPEQGASAVNVASRSG
jgi:FixJ family two-component response regulator